MPSPNAESHLPGCCADNQQRAAPPCNSSTCMRLPDGETCDECGHRSRCAAVFGLEVEGRTHCDWFPRRFVKSKNKETTEGIEQ